MINIGHLAKTYGLLPSEVLARATTYDLMVTDVCATWEKMEADKASGKGVDLNTLPKEQLQEILERTKNGRRDKQKDTTTED